jgi:hypothetical protein
MDAGGSVCLTRSSRPERINDLNGIGSGLLAYVE